MTNADGALPRREVRLGLVLYGGVSLAVYIYGAALECLRLVRASRGADNAYKALLDRIGADVTVDIISGTSAGGINGVALAKALATGVPLEPLKQVWLRDGDLGRLLYPSGAANPPALLDEGYYEERIVAALDRMDHSNEPTKGLVDALDLFISATDLHGHLVGLRDYQGKPVMTRHYRKSFHLKLRARYGRNDFTPDNNRALAKLCRATSAFPVAFRPLDVDTRTAEPLLLTTDDLQPMYLDDPRGVLYLSDGGILNNKPFTELLKTIFHREASREVDRVLVFVEPDPEHIDLDREPPSEPSFLEVALKAGMSIPTYQSLTADLMALEEHNDRVQTYERLRNRLEALLETGYGVPDEQYPEFLQGQLMHRGYMELRAAKVVEHLKELGAGTLGLRSMAYRAFDQELGRMATDAVKGIRDGTEPSVGLLAGYDTAFAVRRAYYLFELMDKHALAWSEQGDQGVGRRLLPELRRAQGRLWEAIDKARDAEWRTWTLEARGPFAQPLKALRDAGQVPKEGRPDQRRLGELREEAVELLRAMTDELDPRLRSSAEDVHQAVEDLDKAIMSAGAAEALGLVTEASRKGFFSVRFDRFEIRDLYMYPLEALGDLGERDPIEVARISPRDATFISKEHKDKLAGDTLAHFGGFLKESWRHNDILWGRMDAAEVLTRVLLWGLVRRDSQFMDKPEDTDEEREKKCRARAERVRQLLQDSLPAIQHEIAREELPRDVGDRSYDEIRRYLENEWRVGEEELKDVPWRERLYLGLRSLRVLRGMFQGVATRPGVHSSFKTLGAFLASGLGWVVRIMTPMVEALAAPDPMVRRLFALGLVGLFSWGLVTLLLQALDVTKFGGKTLGYAAAALVPLLLYGALLVRYELGQRGWVRWAVALLLGVLLPAGGAALGVWMAGMFPALKKFLADVADALPQLTKVLAGVAGALVGGAVVWVLGGLMALRGRRRKDYRSVRRVI